MNEINNWLPLPGTKGFYEVNTDGRVRSTDRIVIKSNGRIQKTKGKSIKPNIQSNGYHFFNIKISGKRSNQSFHKSVAKTFLPNPLNKPCVNHIDGNKSNNSLSNLEWCTYLENNKHARSTKLCVQDGEASPLSKITEEQAVSVIKMYHKEQLRICDIRDKLNIPYGIVQKICNGTRWKHLPRP